MYTSNETLRELDSILKPAIEKAALQVRERKYSKDSIPMHLAQAVKREIDNTRTALSEKIYHIDLAMQGYDDRVERVLCEMQEHQKTTPPQIDPDKYVKEANGGYQVWDGFNWIQLSNQATIDISIEEDEQYGGRSVLKIQASDPKTNTAVLFVDDDVNTPGFNISYSGSGSFGLDGEPQGFEERYMHWKDPRYNLLKTTAATGGIVAGALEARQIGNFTPWNAGEGLKNAKGWYRTNEGLYNKLSHQKGFARGAGGHQMGARNAAGRAGKFMKASRVVFWFSVGVSLYEGFDAIRYDDSNKGEVLTKASIDITMAAIGTFGGPVGWVVSGSYFILDIAGVFGDWGKPSGIRSDGVPYNTNQFGPDRLGTFGQYSMPQPYELDFEMEYAPPIEHIQRNFKEERYETKIDNTYVSPNKLIKTNTEWNGWKK